MGFGGGGSGSSGQGYWGKGGPPCPEKDPCANSFTISYRGVCPPGDVMCGKAMQAAGISPPHYGREVRYSWECVIKFGIGFKAASSAVGTYALSRAAAAGIPGAAGAAAIGNNPGTIAIGGLYAADAVLKHCECGR